MLFYRTDVFDELNLKAPETWDDLLKIAPVLQRNNLQIGVPSGITDVGIYPTLLAQNGLSYYNEDFSGTNFGNEAAIKSFSTWTDFYSKYSFPLSYNFFNRFRSGEMPIGIAAYTTYNYLKAAAPEINGLWKMIPIPKTIREDGTSDDTTVSLASTAGIILKGKSRDNAWLFLKWFVSSQTQAKFGNSVEAVLGSSGRYATANKNAFSNLPWTSSEAEMLIDQWGSVTEMPVIPATYIVDRNICNAFKKVVYYSENSREMLNTYNFIITQEIQRKNEEMSK